MSRAWSGIIQRIEVRAAVLLCVGLAACAADSQNSVQNPVNGAVGGFGGAANQGPSGGGVAGHPLGNAGAAGQLGAQASGSSGASGATPGTGTSSAGKSSMPGAGRGGTPGTSGMAAGGSGTGSGGTPPASGDLCARWKSDRADLSEGTWSGNAASCDAGDMTQQARANAYRLHTLYRFMAGLDPVPMTDDNNKKAQGCALLMAANNMISHTPDSSWKCYTAADAMTAGSSSLSSGGAVSSVDGYMIDPGNPTTLGHRRWVLSSMLAGVGFGSSGKFSCQYQPPTFGAGGKPWIAWPPPGQIPIQAMSSFFSSIDQTGWSLQSDSIDFKSAQVTITSNGMNLGVTVTQLGSGYGSRYAISMIPMGWKAAAGTTYSVSVSGTSMPIAYDVQVIDCK